MNTTQLVCEHVAVSVILPAPFTQNAVFFPTAFWSVEATYSGESKSERERVIPLSVL